MLQRLTSEQLCCIWMREWYSRLVSWLFSREIFRKLTDVVLSIESRNHWSFQSFLLQLFPIDSLEEFVSLQLRCVFVESKSLRGSFLEQL